MINKILIGLLFILSSCEANNNVKSDAIEIDMSLGTTEKTLCDFSKEILIIELETLPNSLIGHVEKIKIVKDKIFIHDLQTQSILIFEYPSGKFISKIISREDNSESYSSISAFDVNNDNQDIYILDGNRKRFLTYTIDGKHIESKKLPFFTHNFSHLNESFVFFNYSISKDDFSDYQIILTDTDLTIKKRAIPIKNHTSISIKQINRVSNFTSSSVLLLPKDTPYAYEIKNNKIYEKYFFDFKDKWKDEMFFSSYNNTSELFEALKKSDIVYGLGAIEGVNFLEIDYWLIDKHFVSLYNKAKGELIHIKQFKNVDFFPRGYFNGFFISVNYLQDLSEEVKNKKANCLYSNFNNSLSNKNDKKNPVLILAKF